VTGLFLRYCAACNSTAPSVAKGMTCAECDGPLKIVDAHALIPALGAKLDEGQRQAAFDSCRGHDLPST
jgi:transcription initiation factor IIE alpha subunit